MKQILVAFFLIFLSVHVVVADDLARIQTEIKQVEQQNKKLDEQVKVSERDVATTKKQLVKTADKVSSLEEERDKISQKIAELDAKRDAIVQDMEKNKEKLGDAAGMILFVASHPTFDSDDMRDYILTSAILTGMADSVDDDINQAAAQVAELEKILNSREIEKDKLDRSAKKYTKEKTELDKLLKTRFAQNQKLKAEQSAAQKRLRELSARAKSISELSAGVGSSEMSADARFSKRKLNLPVRGRVIVRYGEKTALGLKSDGWRIKTRGDALVAAPADGIVKFADSFKGFGRVIIMSHKNGYNTVMTNLGEIDVLIDQEVLAGEPVGRMDNSKTEMYLEVRRNNKAVDPGYLFKEE